MSKFFSSSSSSFTSSSFFLFSSSTERYFFIWPNFTDNLIIVRLSFSHSQIFQSYILYWVGQFLRLEMVHQKKNHYEKYDLCIIVCSNKSHLTKTHSHHCFINGTSNTLIHTLLIYRFFFCFFFFLFFAPYQASSFIQYADSDTSNKTISIIIVSFGEHIILCFWYFHFYFVSLPTWADCIFLTPFILRLTNITCAQHSNIFFSSYFFKEDTLCYQCFVSFLFIIDSFNKREEPPASKNNSSIYLPLYCGHCTKTNMKKPALNGIKEMKGKKKKKWNEHRQCHLSSSTPWLPYDESNKKRKLPAIVHLCSRYSATVLCLWCELFPKIVELMWFRFFFCVWFFLLFVSCSRVCLCVVDGWFLLQVISKVNDFLLIKFCYNKAQVDKKWT